MSPVGVHGSSMAAHLRTGKPREVLATSAEAGQLASLWPEKAKRRVGTCGRAAMEPWCRLQAQAVWRIPTLESTRREQGLWEAEARSLIGPGLIELRSIGTGSQGKCHHGRALGAAADARRRIRLNSWHCLALHALLREPCFAKVKLSAMATCATLSRTRPWRSGRAQLLACRACSADCRSNADDAHSTRSSSGGASRSFACRPDGFGSLGHAQEPGLGA